MYAFIIPIIIDVFLLNDYQYTLLVVPFRLVDTSDLFETLPIDCPDKRSIMTYNCNFKGNGYR